jgi:hypothetical protein
MKTIVIYQPSKVGSTTVIHHMLNHYGLKKGDGIWCPSDNEKYPLNKDIQLFHTHTLFDMPEGLKEKVLGDDEVYFICLTREPISRNMSGFFEPKQFHPVSGEPFGELSDGQIETFKTEFINKFNHLGGIEWFDTEFLNMGLGDLYNLPFNKDVGYSIHENGNKKLLLIRMEDINGKLNKALTEFIGDTFDSEIKINNSSDNREYKEGYNRFKKTITIPKNILDSVYNTEHTKFFYTEEEINEFYKKWEKTV